MYGEGFVFFMRAQLLEMTGWTVWQCHTPAQVVCQEGLLEMTVRTVWQCHTPVQVVCQEVLLEMTVWSCHTPAQVVCQEVSQKLVKSAGAPLLLS